MNPRHEPFDPDERALARLLADDHAGPPPELDARILAAAGESLRHAAPAAPAGPLATAPVAARPASRRRRLRWPTALGLAASVTLAVGVAWQLREPPVPVQAPAGAPATASPEAPVGLVAADATDRIAPAAAPVERPAAVAAEPAAQESQRHAEAYAAATAAAAAQSRQQEQKAAQQARAQAMAEAEAGAQAEAEAAAKAYQARERQAVARAARQSPAPLPAPVSVEEAAPMQAPAPPPPPAPVADVAEARPADTYVAAPAPAAAPQAARSAAFSGMDADLAPAIAAAVDADERLSAPEWLQRIRERRGRGELDAARASLERFAITHPTTPVPDDLQWLLR